MLTKSMLVLSAATVLAVPSAASARHNDGERKQRQRTVYVSRAYDDGYDSRYYRGRHRDRAQGRREYAANRGFGYGYPSYSYGGGYPSYGYGSRYPTYGYGVSYGYPSYGYGGYGRRWR